MKYHLLCDMHGAPDGTDLFVLQIQSGRMRCTCWYLSLYRPISNYGINRLRCSGYRGFVNILYTVVLILATR